MTFRLLTVLYILSTTYIHMNSKLNLKDCMLIACSLIWFKRITMSNNITKITKDLHIFRHVIEKVLSIEMPALIHILY
jgi:hypothetical protein